MARTPHTEQFMTQAKGKVIAIIRLPDYTDAVPLAEAILEGGIDTIEFTLSQPDVPDVIQRVREEVAAFREGRATIGAGTVLTPHQVGAVAKAGGQFIVSPNTDPSVIAACAAYDLPAIPGAFTPTEIQHAWTLGASAVKVFPIATLGADYIKLLRGPLPHLRLIPTGGVTLDNIAALFQNGVHAVGVTTALLDAETVTNHDWNGITSRARTLVAAARDATQP